MKKILFIFVCTLIFGTTSAQDIILKKNADEIPAKVLKIGNTEIEYKKWSNIDGPTYTIATNDVFIIKYQNGTKDVISGSLTNTKSKITSTFPKYQGEIAAAFGLGVGEVSSYINTNRILVETVHGVRINPYLFTGLGLGFNYFYESIDIVNNYGRVVSNYNGAGVLSPFINLKGYYPVTEKFDLLVKTGAETPQKQENATL